jgi:metal-responsive CopG/Arc/MetJ family transcriptional regulator
MERIHFTLPDGEDTRLNNYVNRLNLRNGRIRRDLRNQVIRAAIKEFIDAHEDEEEKPESLKKLMEG